MDALAPLGRLIFSAFFIFSGFNHFAQFESMVGYARSSGLPFPALAVYGSGVVLLVGGVCILLGVFTRVAAAAFAVFLVVTALTMHRFWGGLPADQAAAQLIHFGLNISLAGSALLLVYFGPGPYSVRARSRVRERRAHRPPPVLRPRSQE